MARNLDPKCKICRHVGEKLYLKGERCYSPKCAIVRRPYAPGMHGPKARRKRMSEFAKELLEKQKLRHTYRLLERQFAGYAEEAKRMSGNSGENLLRFLEARLDNVVFRLHFATSRDQARQFVSHGHIFVNSRVTTYPSYQVKAGDKIQVRDESLASPIFELIKRERPKVETPSWLSRDEKELKGQAIGIPDVKVLAESHNLASIAEYYSR